MVPPGGEDDAGSWDVPPPPASGRTGDPNETRLGYQLAAFKDLTNQRLAELTREMRGGFATINTTIASQQYVTRERYDGDRRGDAIEIDNLQKTQSELRGTISRLWWLVGGTLLSLLLETGAIVAMVRGGP